MSRRRSRPTRPRSGRRSGRRPTRTRSSSSASTTSRTTRAASSPSRRRTASAARRRRARPISARALSLSWNTGGGTPINSTPRPMNVNIDPDTTPDTYIEHRELVRIGDAGNPLPPRPTMIRIGSSTGAFDRGSRADLARRRTAADEEEVHVRLHDALHGPDRGLHALRRACGGVPEPRRDDHAAEQDERLPAAGAGADGRPDEPDGNREPRGAPLRRRPSSSRPGPGATRAGTTSRPSSSTRAPPTRRSR